MAYDIGPKVGIEGEAEFKKALSELNTSLKTMGTEMTAVSSAYDKNDKSAEKLTAQNEVLTRQIDAQKDKVALLAAQLEKAQEEYGAGSRQAQALEQQLNNGTAALNKMERQLDSNNTELNKSKVNWGEFGEKAEKAAKAAATAIAAVVTAAAGAAVAIGKMTIDAAASADEILTLSTQTGLSTEAIQKYQYAAELIDVPLETITGSMSKMTKNMATAKKGTGDAATAFKALGISVTDQDGKLRNNQDVFAEAIDALGKMENETQRDAYAMQIFGKSAQDLNPLIQGGAAALEEYGQRAEDAGLILSDDLLGGLGKLDDQIQIFKSTLNGAKNSFATAFAGPMTEGLAQINGYIERLTTSFAEGGFSALAEELGTVLTDMLQALNDQLPNIIDFGMRLIMTLIDGIVKQLPQLVRSASTIIDTVGRGIVAALPELMPAIVDTILAIVDGLIDNIDLLIDAAIAIIGALGQGLLQALPQLIARVPDIIVSIVNALVGGIPKLLDVGVQMVKGLWEGIKSMGKWIGDKVGGFFGGIVDGVKDFLGIHSPSTVFAGVGENMAAGIGVGFADQIAAVQARVQNSVRSVAVAATSAAKINTRQQENTQSIVAGAVNGVAGAIAGAIPQTGGTYNINVQVAGKTLAQVVFDPLREVARQRGVSNA